MAVIGPLRSGISAEVFHVFTQEDAKDGVAEEAEGTGGKGDEEKLEAGDGAVPAVGQGQKRGAEAEVGGESSDSDDDEKEKKKKKGKREGKGAHKISKKKKGGGDDSFFADLL